MARTKSNRDKVSEFHHVFNHPVNTSFPFSDRQLQMLRLKLIAEELTELASALGLFVTIDADEVISVYEFGDESAINVEEVADALGDLEYVIHGAGLCFAMPSDLVFDEIHRSNMSKLDADGKPIYRDDGKILKGPNYFKPNIAHLVKHLKPSDSEKK